MAAAENQDPVKVCIECLQSGTNKELACEQAQIALDLWWAVDVTEQNLSHEQLKELLDIRTIVMGTIAAIYIWNEAYEQAEKLEEEFLYKQKLWEGDNREVINIYLMLLMIQKQFDHLERLFASDEAFKNSFLTHHDVYQSILDPQYEFESSTQEVVSLVNRVNGFSRVLKGEDLM